MASKKKTRTVRGKGITIKAPVLHVKGVAASVKAKPTKKRGQKKRT
jgi:hypothetical protein